MYRKFIGTLCLLIAMQVQAQESEWVYYTSQGDTIWDICLKYTNKRGCWITLTKYNQVENDRAIPVNTPIRIPFRWLKNLPVVGEVVYVTGEAKYSKWDDQQFVTVIPGQKVHLGSRVRTETESIVKLLLHQTNEVLLKESSELVLERFSSRGRDVLDEEMTLEQGSVEAEVNSGKIKNRFIIKTPAAIAAVRGTQFRVNSRGNKMRGEVLEGQLDVSSGSSRQSVPAGFGVSAIKGKKIQPPRALPPQPQLTQASVKSPLPARVDWNPVNQVSQYQVSLYNGKQEILSIETVNHNWVVYDTLDNGCYQVEVHGIDDEGFHGIDSHAPLCVIDALASVVLNDEVGITDNGDHLLLSWKATPEAASYRVQSSLNQEFSDIVQDSITSKAQMTLPKIEGENVYMRVIAIDGRGHESSPSNVLAYSDRKSQLFDIIVTFVLVAITFL
ncbi:MAG: FecR domain-containing protein [Porticoccus sp.]|nr:FecR domain-containing protein [Porticoccus sp.]